jgi:hypothetical protein
MGDWAMRSRVPFDFALMDRRHRPFVEGRRDAFLTPFQLIGERKRFKLLCEALVATFFLCLGVLGLIHDFSVEWNTAEAVIIGLTPMQKNDHFDWWYLYSFKMESGQGAQGKIVLSERDRFSVGDRIPVLYVRNDPQDNRYANDPLPRKFLYWVFVGAGVSVVGAAGLVLLREIEAYRAWRRVAFLGHPVPGEVISARWGPWVKSAKDPKLDIEYMLNTPEGRNVRAQAQISASDVADKAEPGVIVAVWYAPDRGYLLL